MLWPEFRLGKHYSAAIKLKCCCTKGFVSGRGSPTACREESAMSSHASRIEWSRGSSPFSDDSYTRGHRWILDGGIEVPASSAPGIPNAVERAIDPEEGVLSSLASCHMLFFLALAMR